MSDEFYNFIYIGAITSLFIFISYDPELWHFVKSFSMSSID